MVLDVRAVLLCAVPVTQKSKEVYTSRYSFNLHNLSGTEKTMVEFQNFQDRRVVAEVGV
jgi:hypothetical protein